MFRFAEPQYLWLLLVIPFLIVLKWMAWRARKRKIRKLGDEVLIKELMPDVSRWRDMWKFILLLLALILLTCVLARPQAGSKIQREKRNGIETIICLDISNSMLAQDVAPSRLEKSKLMVENLVDHFTNDKIGLIVFAGDAYVQLPITSDYVSAKMFLQSISPALIQAQGTNIGEAVELALNSFTPEDGVGRAIVVITDGEDHEGGAEAAAKTARKQGVNVYVLGIGSTKGAPIPTGGGDYLKDNAGNVVMTALNEDMCRAVAQAGKGKYIHVDNTGQAQESLDDEISRLQKGETESVIYSEYDEQFQAFALLALLLLVIEVCVMEARNPWLKGVKLFKRKE